VTNKQNFVSDCSVIRPVISDHFLIEISVVANFKHSHNQTHSIKLYKKANYDAVSALLKEAMAEIENSINNRENINTVWEIIETAFKIAANKFVPKCQPKNRNIREPIWFNNTANRMAGQTTT